MGHARRGAQPFVSLEVERGGTGSGTVIRVRTRAMGRSQSFRSVSTATTVPARIAGILQRWLMPPILRRIFKRELALLAQVATARS